MLKAGDLEAAHRDRAPAIVQSIEGSQFLDARIERVAEVYRRGVVGVWAIAPTFESLPAFVDGIARAVDAVGVDHVGLGSDVGGAARNAWPDYGDFPVVVRRLRQKGFSAEEVGKLVGGNYVHVFNASVRKA